MNKAFDVATIFVIAVWLLGLLISLGITGFVIWAIIMTMKYFGVI